MSTAHIRIVGPQGATQPTAQYLESAGFSVILAESADAPAGTSRLSSGPREGALCSHGSPAPALVMLCVPAEETPSLAPLHTVRQWCAAPIMLLVGDTAVSWHNTAPNAALHAVSDSRDSGGAASIPGVPAVALTGLEQGADDYLSIPFNPRVLLAKVRAMLRRASSALGGDNPRLIECGGLTLNAESGALLVGNAELRLSALESRLMAELMRRADTTCRRIDLLAAVWGRGNAESAGARTLDVHISRLRRALAPFAAHRDRIRTVRGTGYMFVSE